MFDKDSLDKNITDFAPWMPEFKEKRNDTFKKMTNEDLQNYIRVQFKNKKISENIRKKEEADYRDLLVTYTTETFSENFFKNKNG